MIVAIRPGFNPSDIPNWILSNVQFSNIPRIEISSSIIRERWKNGKTIRYMVTQPVWKYINDNKNNNNDLSNSLKKNLQLRKKQVSERDDKKILGKRLQKLVK